MVGPIWTEIQHADRTDSEPKQKETKTISESI
jgi:hypothetical protein